MILHDKHLAYILDIDGQTLTSLDPRTGEPLVTSTFYDLSVITWNWLKENLSDEFWEWVPEQTNWTPFLDDIPVPYAPSYKSAASGWVVFNGAASA